MRLTCFVCSIVVLATLIGCGGGDGGGSAGPSVTIVVPPGAAPTGITPSVTYKSASQLPNEISPTIFIAAAQCLPAGTEFSTRATLSFHLATPLTNGISLGLFEWDGTGNFIEKDVQEYTIAISSDRMTVNVHVDNFSQQEYYALLKI
ncbi:MAG: hypothetical protein ABFD54_11870 [Armatimonadota bacterium]|nr:hypothetical protein [bacterium]